MSSLVALLHHKTVGDKRLDEVALSKALPFYVP